MSDFLNAFCEAFCKVSVRKEKMNAIEKLTADRDTLQNKIMELIASFEKENQGVTLILEVKRNNLVLVNSIDLELFKTVEKVV